MLIWFSLIIPILAILIMAIAFQKRMAFWEYIILLIIPICAIVIAKQVSISTQTMTTEYWNSYLVSAEYYEPWSTWHDETCTRQVACGTDDEGNTEYCTESYDCSHCDETGPSWRAHDNIGNSFNISETYYRQLCKIWSNETKIELNRHIDKHWGCGVDGEKFETIADTVFAHTQTVCEKHTYENRVKCSKSVFNFSDVDSATKKDLGLYDYVNDFDIFDYNPIMGWNDGYASKRLAWWNAHIGAPKKVHMMILVFQNKPLDAGMYQEQYWKNGNKNEFILCIGIDNDKKIKWTRSISWTEVDILKVKLQEKVLEMPFDLPAIVDTMAIMVRKDFKKKSFDDFKYLSVEPTDGAIMWTFIIVAILTIGLCVFSVMNPWGRDGTDY